MDHLETHHKSLNIIHAHNTQLYTNYLKHSNYTSVFSCCLKEKITDEDCTQADLSLKKTNVQISLPHPISNPFVWEIQPDPCLELIKNKAEYNRKLDTYRYLYKKDEEEITWANINKEKKGNFVNLPTYLVDLVVHGDENPYFDGTYDWFYTGGNLDVIQLEDNPLLIYPQGHNIVSLNLNNSIQNQLKIESEAPIYNIQGHNINNRLYLTLRTKETIQVVKLKLKPSKSSKVKTHVVYKTQVTNEAPFIDCLLFGKDKLITANVAYEVKMHDIETQQANYQRKFDLPSNQVGDLCQLKTISNCLIFMARKCLNLLDFRSGDEKTKEFKEGFFQCDELCAICVSCLNENLLYVASKHSLYKCDLRVMKVVKKWAHLMDNSPIIIKTAASNNCGEEYVFISSFTETICILISSYNHLPFKIPNITKTFNKLQSENEYFVREDLEKRFKLSTAGLATYNSKIYTTNSIGDVYTHKIDCNEFHNKKSVEKLVNYINETPHKAKTLQATHFKELSSLKKSIFTKHIDAETLMLYNSPNPARGKYLAPGAKFGKYDMAMIWASERDGPLDVTEQPEDRVDSWLRQTAVEGFTPFDEPQDEFL